MAESVAVKSELIRWAMDRSRVPFAELAKAFPKLDKWLAGERQPTYKQLEHFAQKTMTPLGYFFLDNPPDEPLPIPDFRTVGDACAKAVGAAISRGVGTSDTARMPNACAWYGAGRQHSGRPDDASMIAPKPNTPRRNVRAASAPSLCHNP
jgi:hypothetical protein